MDAVCHVPFGAHPSYAQGYYDRDNAAYMEWEEISRDAERIERYLQEWVSGVDSRETYREKLGAQVRERLTVGSRPSGAVDFGDC